MKLLLLLGKMVGLTTMGVYLEGQAKRQARELDNLAHPVLFTTEACGMMISQVYESSLNKKIARRQYSCIDFGSKWLVIVNVSKEEGFSKDP